MAELSLIHSFWDVTKTGKEEWGMRNGERGMGKEEWGKRNGEWGMRLGLSFNRWIVNTLTLTLIVVVSVRLGLGLGLVQTLNLHNPVYM